MILCYELSMPGRASWNGRWSGEDRCFALVRSYRGKEREAKMQKVLETQPHFYRWDDGWCARVSVRQVDQKEAARMRRRSQGFAAYDWMVDSLQIGGRILAPHERPAEEGQEVS